MGGGKGVLQAGHSLQPLSLTINELLELGKECLSLLLMIFLNRLVELELTVEPTREIWRPWDTTDFCFLARSRQPMAFRNEVRTWNQGVERELEST